MDYWDPSDGCCDFWSIWKSPQRFWSSRWCRRIALLLLWTYGWSKVILNKLSNETISTNIYTSNFEILKLPNLIITNQKRSSISTSLPLLKCYCKHKLDLMWWLCFNNFLSRCGSWTMMISQFCLNEKSRWQTHKSV